VGTLPVSQSISGAQSNKWVIRACEKWGQAPAKQRNFLGFAWDGRSQSPFFHKLSAVRQLGTVKLDAERPRGQEAQFVQAVPCGYFIRHRRVLQAKKIACLVDHAPAIVLQGMTEPIL
jgi:hypothetical protein